MNWNNVLENALGNLASDMIVGILFGSVLTIIITKFFELLNQKKESVGALTLIKSEILSNNYILTDLLEIGIKGFEKEYKRGERYEMPVDDVIFTDAARFLRISTDNLLFAAFNATYVGLGNLENKTLLEKIVKLYTNVYHYNLKTGFQMEQLNWVLIDQMKDKIQKVILDSKSIAQEIDMEIKKQKEKNTFIQAIKFWIVPK